VPGVGDEPDRVRTEPDDNLGNHECRVESPRDSETLRPTHDAMVGSGEAAPYRMRANENWSR
jgi:hypothetical protein